MGIRLRYEPNTGLIVTDETSFVPYTKYVDCKTYFKDMSENIKEEYNSLILK